MAYGISALINAASGRQSPPFWERVLGLADGIKDPLDRWHILVELAPLLPAATVEAGFRAAQSDPVDCDRIDAELAFIPRLTRELRKQTASEWLAQVQSRTNEPWPGDREALIQLLTTLASDELPPTPPESWTWQLGSSPGAKQCLALLGAREGAEDGSETSVEGPQVVLESANGVNNHEPEFGEEDDDHADSRPDGQLGEIGTVHEAAFRGLMEIAEGAASDARTTVLTLARHIVLASDPEQRWDRLIRILRLEPDPSGSETEKACESYAMEQSNHLDAAFRWAELCITTGDANHANAAVSRLDEMHFRQTGFSGGGYSEQEEEQDFWSRCAVWLALAGATRDRGDESDDLLLRALHDLLLTFGSDRLYRSGAIKNCVKLLNPKRLNEVLSVARTMEDGAWRRANLKAIASATNAEAVRHTHADSTKQMLWTVHDGLEAIGRADTGAVSRLKDAFFLRSCWPLEPKTNVALKDSSRSEGFEGLDQLCDVNRKLLTRDILTELIRVIPGLWESSDNSTMIQVAHDISWSTSLV